MTNESDPPHESGQLALTPEQEAALKALAAGEGDPLVLARILRPVAHFLETYPPANAATEHARTVRGLVQLSNPDAVALVERGRVPVDRAADVGHRVRDSFVYHHPPEVCADFEIRALTWLADGKPVSAKFAGHFKDPIEEVANEVINERKVDQRRLDRERIWNQSYWSFWTTLSWIAFREMARLCEDRRGFSRLMRYESASQKVAYPERGLLAALKGDELKAIRNSKELPALYWADKDHEVDRDVWLRRTDVLRCWPAPGEGMAAGQPENVSYAQAQDACNRREALKQYKARLKQGVEIRAELLKACSAQDNEVPSGAPGSIAEALDLWSSWGAADMADLREEDAARHAALKNALTPELATALRDLEAGKLSTVATARLFQSMPPHVLDMLPDVPLIQKIRTLVSMLNARDKRNEDDSLLTIGQTLLWRLTGTRELLDLASNDSGRLGVSTAQVVAAELFDALNLPHERIQDEAHELRRRCLAGRLTAKDYNGREITKDAWIQMEIVLSGNVSSVRRSRRDPASTVYDDIFFERDEVLREFSPEEPSDDPMTDKPGASAGAEFPFIGMSASCADDANDADIRRDLEHAYRSHQQERRAAWFKLRQWQIPLERRHWLYLTDVAEEYARRPKSLTIDRDEYEVVLEELRRSILAGEFEDGWGRSRVLCMHPDRLSELRFNRRSATHADYFRPIVEHLCITRRDCAEWFNRRRLELPHRLQCGLSPTAEIIAVGEAINGAVNLYASGITQVDADYDERTGDVRPITTDSKGIEYGANMMERLDRSLDDKASTMAINTAKPAAQPAEPPSWEPKPVSNKGGAPTDRDRIIAEARRRIDAKENLPTTLTKFAEQLREWLEGQPGAVRRSKTNEVMSADTIEGHVRTLWAAYRDSPPS
jgi:hypothetical protein